MMMSAHRHLLWTWAAEKKFCVKSDAVSCFVFFMERRIYGHSWSKLESSLKAICPSDWKTRQLMIRFILMWRACQMNCSVRQKRFIITRCEVSPSGWPHVLVSSDLPERHLVVDHLSEAQMMLKPADCHTQSFLQYRKESCWCVWVQSAMFSVSLFISSCCRFNLYFIFWWFPGFKVFLCCSRVSRTDKKNFWAGDCCVLKKTKHAE